MKTLHVHGGFCLDTPEGHQAIVAQHGPTCYIVHNFDPYGRYTGASYLTDREIIHKWHDMTGKLYDTVEFDGRKDPL